MFPALDPRVINKSTRDQRSQALINSYGGVPISVPNVSTSVSVDRPAGTPCGRQAIEGRLRHSEGVPFNS